MEPIRITALSDLRPGTVTEVSLRGKPVAVCNVDGTVHAFEGVCPHLGGPLGEGNVVDGNLVCPWHGWEFRCATGEADHNAGVKLKRYAVEVRDGAVFVSA